MGKKAKAEGGDEVTGGSEVNGSNGAILFEKMPDDFAIPARTRGGAWDEVIEKLMAKENKGKVICVYRAEKAEAQHTYTRAKALKQALERKELADKITVAVRLHNGQSILLAQAS